MNVDVKVMADGRRSFEFKVYTVAEVREVLIRLEEVWRPAGEQISFRGRE